MLKVEIREVYAEVVPDHFSPAYFDNDLNRYEGLEPAERAEYERQDAERVAARDRDEWWYVGVRAVAALEFKTPQGGWIMGPRVISPGLWGIESDSDSEYLADVANEQRADLAEMLMALGLTDAEIAAAESKGGAELREVA